MRVELRKRNLDQGRVRYDAVLVCESDGESVQIDQLGKLGVELTASVRLADGYGEHYILIEGKEVT